MGTDRELYITVVISKYDWEGFHQPMKTRASKGPLIKIYPK